MLQKQTVNKTIRTITFGLLACVLLPNLAHARGSFPEVINPGKCIKTDGTDDPNTSTRAVLRKSQGIWYFSMETTGVNSEGTWSIIAAKNKLITDPALVPDVITYEPPGGWGYVGGRTDTFDKRTVTFVARATKLKSLKTTSPVSATGIGDVCNVTISIKI